VPFTLPFCSHLRAGRELLHSAIHIANARDKRYIGIQLGSPTRKVACSKAKTGLGAPTITRCFCVHVSGGVISTLPARQYSPLRRSKSPHHSPQFRPPGDHTFRSDASSHTERFFGRENQRPSREGGAKSRVLVLEDI
jgi:hypothetical protein